MSNNKKISFLSFFRLTVLVVLFTVFPFLATRTYAVQPVQGSWTLVNLSDKFVRSLAVDPTNPNILYAGTQWNGVWPGVFKSTDSGATWTEIVNGLPVSQAHIGYDAIAIDPSNPNVVYVGITGDRRGDGLSYEGIFKSTDSGANWTEITPGNPNPDRPYTSVIDIAIDPTNTNTIYIAGATGCNSVWKSTDGGANWTQKPGPYCDTSRVALDPANPNTVYAINSGNVLKSIDGASSWSIVLAYNPNLPIANSNAPIAGLTIDSFNTNIVYASSGRTGVYKSTDGGANWTFLTGSPTTIQNGVITDPARDNTLYAANSIAYQSTNAGASWSSINTGFPSAGYGFLLRPNNDPDVLYAGVWGGGGFYVYGLASMNQSPQINPLQSTTIIEGNTYTVNGSFTDTDSTSWTATVNYSDGSGVQPLTLNPDKTFSLSHLYKDNGTYTVIVSVTDNQGATGSSSATVTVNNVSPSVGNITITPSPAHINEAITVSANFTDAGVLDSHTASWNWGDSNTTTGTVTEVNGSGSVSNTHTYTNFGTYTITLTVEDKDNATGTKTTTITVVKQITVLNPAEVWLSKGLLNVGVRFDVLAEAYKDTTLVSSGQLNSVQVDSGGFNNADLISIPFNSFSPVDFPQGSELKMKLSVRNACTGSLLNSGTARLWFNDSQANSHFGATIGTVNNPYYLLDNLLLSTTVDAGPRQNIDVAAGAKCSPFKPFGTWTIAP